MDFHFQKHSKQIRNESSSFGEEERKFPPVTDNIENGVLDHFEKHFSKAGILLFPLNGPVMNRFVSCQETFRQMGKPITVQIAFHYTRSNVVDSILSNGLVTDRPTRNGALFGDGIYTCTNPYAFSLYGDIGIVVLILPGVSKQRAAVNRDLDSPNDVDSYLGNKLIKKFENGVEFPRSTYFDELVITKGQQVLPVCCYNRAIANNRELMFDLTCFWQNYADVHFNGNERTPVSRCYPSFQDLAFEHRLAYKQQKRFWEVHGHKFQRWFT